jgi:hypothetical protein
MPWKWFETRPGPDFLAGGPLLWPGTGPEVVAHPPQSWHTIPVQPNALDFTLQARGNSDGIYALFPPENLYI